jgi:hypothetical protein
MAFKSQIESDLSVFFNTDEFAYEATYTPAGSGTSQPVDYIDESEDPGIMENIVPGDEKVILIQAEGVTPARGDVFLIDSENWKLTQVLSKSAGTFRVKLSRSEWRAPGSGWRAT